MNHRLEFRHGDKEHLVERLQPPDDRRADLVALAMTGVTALVTDFVFGTVEAIVTTTAIGLAFALLWYVLPLGRRRKLSRRRGEDGRA